MSQAAEAGLGIWDEALLAAALFAVDPAGLGGVALKAAPGPVRESWLALLRQWLPAGAPVRRLPLNITDGRLLGGLDLAATLRAGRPVAERGVLAESDGGVLLLPMAERLSPGTAARLAAVLDSGEVAMERDGFALRAPARVGLVLLDEGLAEEERPPVALLDRLAFQLDLSSVGTREAAPPLFGLEEVLAARAGLPAVAADQSALEALCATAAALGIASVRAALLALRAARAAAALAGRTAVGEEDATLAARLVLAPRATVLPAPAPAEQSEPQSPETDTPPEGEPEQGARQGQEEPQPANLDRPLEDVVLEAARAAIPAGLLAALALAGGRLPRGGQGGRAGQVRQGGLRGRPAGVRVGEPRAGARLNVVETLRAAAPWQGLRRRELGERGSARVQVRREDFRVSRYKERTQTTTVFLVDASGSSALHRLAEAKGAVELLLADCYVRRDRVALVAFRGRDAELLLPPTRSLVRAKRSLAGLPGGGGTPLAAGLDAGWALADALARRGETPTLVVLTDGRANIARDGSPGRPRAQEDALASARRLRAAGVRALLVDTSPQPQASAQRLAEELGARYLPLPYADAAVLGRAVRAATGAGGARAGGAPAT